MKKNPQEKKPHTIVTNRINTCNQTCADPGIFVRGAGGGVGLGSGQSDKKHFQGGGSNFFQGGPIETPITCDFSGGSGPSVPPPPPLDPHLPNNNKKTTSTKLTTS